MAQRADRSFRSEGGLARMDGAHGSGSCGSDAGSEEDDGLEHLSAEEKACLLFLEETLQSLDDEDDGRLSDGGSSRLSNFRKVANELTGLLASKPKHARKTPSEEEKTDLPPAWNHVVPAPSRTTSTRPRSPPAAKPELASKQNLLSKPLLNASSQQGHRAQETPAAPPPPPGANAAVPSSTKPRHFFMRTAEGALPRGPLSYDALVYLRKSTSTKKTPLCPTVDHTLDSGEEPPAAAEGLTLGSSRPHSQAGAAGRPPLPPKPKVLPAAAPVPSDSSSSSSCLEHVAHPEVVRLEALQKLGLLKEEEAEGDALGPLPPRRPHPLPQPPRKPVFRPSRVHGSEPPQSSASIHRGWGEAEATGLQRSATQQTLRPDAPWPCSDTASVGPRPAAPPRAQNPSTAVGYSVMVLPGMGADRKEALRKLGLLKN